MSSTYTNLYDRTSSWINNEIPLTTNQEWVIAEFRKQYEGKNTVNPNILTAFKDANIGIYSGPKVNEKKTSSISFISSFLPTTADIGKPLAILLPKVARSGVILKSS